MGRQTHQGRTAARRTVDKPILGIVQGGFLCDEHYLPYNRSANRKDNILFMERRASHQNRAKVIMARTPRWTADRSSSSLMVVSLLPSSVYDLLLVSLIRNFGYIFLLITYRM
jgi:hypothetical protein